MKRLSTHGGSKKEEVIRTKNGKKSYRRPDITMRDPKTGKRYRENVGRRNKRGDPVKRERDAKKDIEDETGESCGFSSYDPK